MALVVSRFEFHLIGLDPTQGHEMRKTRPCVVISPDEMNRHIDIVIVAPMTTKGRGYPTRIPVKFQYKNGQIVLDQIRTVDKARLLKRLGKISPTVASQILVTLQEMFAP